MREPGYYRVMRLVKWEIAFWTGTAWKPCQSLLSLSDSSLTSIDETPIDPKPVTDKITENTTTKGRQA